MEETKIYQKTWFIILMLIIFFPVGLFLMWRYSSWNKVVKILVSAVFAIALIISFVTPSDSSSKQTDNNEVVEQEQQEDLAKSLKDKYDLGEPYEAKTQGSATWLCVSTAKAEANDPKEWAEDYWKQYGEPGSVIYVSNFANHTTTVLRNDSTDGLLLNVQQMDGVDEVSGDSHRLVSRVGSKFSERRGHGESVHISAHAGDAVHIVLVNPHLVARHS